MPINETIQNISPDSFTHITSTVSFKGTGMRIIERIVELINNLLTKFIPGGEVYIVVFASIIWAFLLRKKWNLGWFGTVFYFIVIFSFFRYWCVGGC